jgi:hypothetical protein
MSWSIPDEIERVERLPYGDDMTSSFQIGAEWYTMPYRMLREAGRGKTNIEIMEWVLSQPRRFGLVRYRPPWTPPENTGFIYVIER